MNDTIEILEPRGEGYGTVLTHESWRIGLITPAERFTNSHRLERHMLTDEAFILLSGNATLLHEDTEGTLYRYAMQYGKVYRVPRAAWHHVIIEPGAVVMVVENADTGPDNTEYRSRL